MARGIRCHSTLMHHRTNAPSHHPISSNLIAFTVAIFWSWVIIKADRLRFRMGRFFTRGLFWLFVVLAILCSVTVLTVRFALLPNIQHYQTDIISRVSTLSGMDVSAGIIRGGWEGLRPYVEMEDVVFLEPASSTSAPLVATT